MEDLQELLLEIFKRRGNGGLIMDFKVLAKEKLTIEDHIRFWLRIIQDHMVFIMERTLMESHGKIATQLYNRTEELKNTSNILNKLTELILLVTEVRQFKIQLLNINSNTKPEVLLPPTFISHMLNEIEKFNFILIFYAQNKQLPPIFSLNEHELWLADICGHLQTIKDNLDPVEQLLAKRVYKHKKLFQKLHNKAIEFICYTKHEIVPANAVATLNQQAALETLVYLALVREILALIENKSALGILDERMLIHMFFEQVYFLKSLNQSIDNYSPIQKFPSLLNIQ